MRLHPEATLSAASLAAISDAYGLGEPLDSTFIARGAMGAVNRITTRMHGERVCWTVKRAYWNHFSEDGIRREVDFATRCGSVRVPAPRSIRRIDNGSFVLTVDDQPDGKSQYRVLAWVPGETGDREDDRTIAPITEWMARIHNLAVDPNDHAIDDWFVRVKFNWDELATRMKDPAPDIADAMHARRADLNALSDLVNSAREPGALWCHTDLGAPNLIWSDDGPWLIDWENAGPLVPHQELGSFVRSLGSRVRGKSAYLAYRRAGGPAEITEPSHLASSVAVHLNYLGCQSELLLDATHPEQHDFAREQAGNAANDLPSLAELEALIDHLNGRT
ncbi:phosphotransferase [Actinopolymorpha sp. B11F2]|uniref:phosphotransferase n=1 Tax=Actinopolymorpha sp. B11F2 TaxID=3160862 RepID=UPI0032E3FE07